MIFQNVLIITYKQLFSLLTFGGRGRYLSSSGPSPSFKPIQLQFHFIYQLMSLLLLIDNEAERGGGGGKRDYI